MPVTCQTEGEPYQAFSIEPDQAGADGGELGGDGGGTAVFNLQPTTTIRLAGSARM